MHSYDDSATWTTFTDDTVGSRENVNMLNDTSRSEPHERKSWAETKEVLGEQAHVVRAHTVGSSSRHASKSMQQ